MEGINTQIEENVNDGTHYLKKSKQFYPDYFEGFKTSINSLKVVVSNKKLKDLLNNKFQIRDSAFKEKAFIQTACETTINAYFAKKYPETFQYEEKLNPANNKDVDCGFMDMGFKYNVEVKCSGFDSKEAIDRQYAFKFGTAGRIPEFDHEFETISKYIKMGRKNLGEDDSAPKDVVQSKNMDNNMKGFLISAHEKFNPNPVEDEVNILAVCCGNPQDMQNWFSYLYANKGLFTPYSFCDHNEYKRVDLVILSNLYHRHHEFYEKESLHNHWFFEHAFNLICCNPLRFLSKERAIKSFTQGFPNYSTQLMNHNVLGDVPQYIKDVLRIPDFIRVELEEKGIHLF